MDSGRSHFRIGKSPRKLQGREGPSVTGVSCVLFMCVLSRSVRKDDREVKVGGNEQG